MPKKKKTRELRLHPTRGLDRYRNNLSSNGPVIRVFLDDISELDRTQLLQLEVRDAERLVTAITKLLSGEAR